MGAWRAIKIIRRDSFGSNRPFEREFEGIKKFEPVSHANDSQLDILHVGENREEGYFYYVMELADDRQRGRDIEPESYQPRTLQSDLQEHRRLAANDCLQVGITLCKALEHLHAHGLIHRDIKPSNIIFLHGRPKLADIGLVANIDQTMSFVGTEGFVPPEGPGTVRADLYSLGKVLYELHTGLDRSQFPELPTMLKEAEDPTLARELNLVIIKACAPEHGKRHVNAAELREELELLLKGKSIQRLRNAEKRAVIFRRLSIAAGIVAIVAMIAYLAALRANRRADENARSAQNELWNARLAEARAGRLSRETGRKFTGAEAIAAAARVRPSLALRNEAIANMALFDFGPPRETHPYKGQSQIVAIDSEVQQVATIKPDGLVRIQQVGANAVREWKEYVGSPVHSAEFARRGKALILNLEDQSRAFIDLDHTNRFDLKASERFAGYATDDSFGIVENKTLVVRDSLRDSELCRVETSEPILGAAFHLESESVVLFLEGAVEAWNWPQSNRIGRATFVGGASSGDYSPPFCAIGGANGDITIINFETGRSQTWHAHQDVVASVAFITGEGLLVSSSFDGVFSVWRVDSTHAEFSGTREVPFEFNPAAARVAYRTYNAWGWGDISRRHGYRSIELSRELSPDGRHLDFSPDGQFIVVRGPSDFAILRADSGRVLASRPMQAVAASFVGPESLLTMSRDKLEVWRLSCSADQTVQLSAPERVDVPPLGYLENAYMTRNGHFLAMTGGDTGLLVRNVTNSTTKLFHGAARPRSPVVTEDGKYLVTGTFHGEGPWIWDIASGEVLLRLERDNSNVYLSPDNKALLVAGTLTYSFYEVGTWKLLKQIPSESGHDLPNSAAWSPTGNYLAIVKRRNQPCLLDARSFTELATFTSSDPLNVVDLKFNPAGTILVVSTEQSRLELWDLPSINRQLQTLGLHWDQSAGR
jgi:WD40 repeat protein